MKKNYLLLIIVLLFISSCNEAAKPTNSANVPVPVNVYTVHKENVVYYDQFPGTIVAQMQVDIRAEVEGYITGIFFSEGCFVKKGQKLYEIDNSKYKANNNMTLANLKVAEANLDQAQKDADRYAYLNEHDAVAKQTLDHAMTTLQNAKNQVNAVKQDMIRTQTDLNYSIIKAPFDGTIGISQVKLGNTVTTGQTILNTISTNNPMAVDFVVNEKQISRFVQLQKNSPANIDSVFRITLPDNTLYNQIGKIYILDRAVNSQTGTLNIRLEFPNPDALLKAGMSCTVKVKNQDTLQQMLIPGKAVVEQMGEYFAFVSVDTLIPNNTPSAKQEKGLHAIQRKLILGRTIGDKIIVKSGLQTDDKVIIDGVQKLRDGTLVNEGAVDLKNKK